jgi:hypothetical protein
MSAVWRAMFATLCFSVCVNAQTRTLAVYGSPAEHLDSTTFHELQRETQRLLAPAAIEVVWHQAEEQKFDRVAVATFDGDCSVAELPRLTAGNRSTRAFGDTAVGKDWQVQPFFHLNCAQVIRTLRPSLEHLSVPMRNLIFGRALARVIAHELYHIVAQTTDHAEAGVAKPSFSSEDLMTERFDFSHASLERLLLLSAQKLTFTAN